MLFYRWTKFMDKFMSNTGLSNNITPVKRHAICESTLNRWKLTSRPLVRWEHKGFLRSWMSDALVYFTPKAECVVLLARDRVSSWKRRRGLGKDLNISKYFRTEVSNAIFHHIRVHKLIINLIHDNWPTLILQASS